MYNQLYDNSLIRNSKYNIIEYVLPYYKSNYKCLDLGCGSCRKIIDLCSKVKSYYAMDIDEKRVFEAKKKCKGLNNIIIGIGDNFYLPFDTDSFDLISCFMSKYSVGEAARVLKNNGIFIIETTGANDKKSIRKAFGKDDFGWRGRMLSDTPRERILRLKNELSPFFKIENMHIVKFKTKISSALFVELLHMTNEIRGFNDELDRKIIESLEDENKNIEFEEERVIIIAVKHSHMA